MRKLILGLLVCVSLFGSDFEDAKKAYDNGEYKKAAELYTKDCDSGDASECFLLGYMYHFGKGVKQDYIKSAELWEKACDGGNAEGCYGLGLIYHLGKGVKQDFQKALELYGMACDMKFEVGCKNYASLKKALGQ